MWALCELSVTFCSHDACGDISETRHMGSGNHCFGQLMFFCSPLALAALLSNVIIVNILNLLTVLYLIKHKGSFIHKYSHSNKTAEGFLSYSWVFLMGFVTEHSTFSRILWSLILLSSGDNSTSSSSSGKFQIHKPHPHSVEPRV